MHDDYSPIDCALHDHLEASATLGVRVHITYVDEAGAIHETDDRIADVFARVGAEYVKLAGGLEIRLDRLETVDGVRFGSSC